MELLLYAVVGAVSVALACLVKKEETVYGLTRQRMLNGICLTGVFALLFAVSACRLNVGNDYARYAEFMHLINSNAYVPTEAGFNWVVRVVYAISGYENFLLVFAVFAFFTLLFFFLAMWNECSHFGWTFFLFMSLGYYFQTFNTVRYYLALALALYSIRFVMRRQWARFVVLILLGALFHKSILVVIPLYVLAAVPWRRWQLALAGLFCTTFFFMQDFYLNLVLFLYPTYAETEYLEGGTSYVSILRCAAVLVLSLLCYKQTVKGDRRNSFYFYCNLGALVLYVCCSFLPVISRIGYYLTITHIFFIPSLLAGIPERRVRRFFTGAAVLAAVCFFILFLLRAGSDGIRILPYQTFMFHDMVPIHSEVN